MNPQKFLLQAFMPVWLGFFTRPSTIVPLLHRRMACIFKLFTPLASFSDATWSSATFIASWSEPRICWNFDTPMVFIALQPLGLGLFAAPSPIVPSLHRLKPSIFKLFKTLASFSYAIWSSATFVASCIEPWIHGSFYYNHSYLYDLDISHVHLRLYLCCTDGWLVFLNSLHL